MFIYTPFWGKDQYIGLKYYLYILVRLFDSSQLTQILILLARLLPLGLAAPA